MGKFLLGTVAHWPELAGLVRPLVTADPGILFESGGMIRGAVAFIVVVLIGAAIRWRFEPFLERSIDASRTKPLLSLAYGAAAHGVIAFGGVYLTSQLGPIRIAGWSAGTVGVVSAVLLFGVAGSLGFTVVGATVVELAWEPVRWAGVLVGGLVAGLVAGLDPRFAATGWFVLVSLGIGGPVRTWFHASAVDEV